MHAEPLAVPQPPYSPQLAGLVKDMLEKNPHKRTSLKAVLAAPIVRARMARFVEEFVAKGNGSLAVVKVVKPAGEDIMKATSLNA
ncbi:hypothetical protein T492DRAFT_865294 [Pavlovales sp. CCMP2436]|nr:hypothetical protein T492DRAFT_865294 [Pavlovales sp. CCMP2436]